MRRRKDPVTPELYEYLVERDGRCAMATIAPEHVCEGPSEIDHVRASGGLSLRSPSTRYNCVRLCRAGHRTKTEWGRLWRPLLIAYINRRENDGQT